MGKRTIWRLTALATLAIAVCAATVLTFIHLKAAYAAGAYSSGETGYDISWPQCGGAYPTAPFAFGIVGVTDGRTFTLNPCLAGEYTWAQSAANASQTGLYMNLSYPAGSTATQGQSGPYGHCKKGSACYAQNYGWNAAQYAYTQNGSAAPLQASYWWLDIETGSSWSRTTALNADVIQGAIAYLQARGVTVGVYSTASQWRTIAGSYAPTIPNWVAGASASNPGALCSSPLYANGAVWLTQYVNGGFDTDYSC